MADTQQSLSFANIRSRGTTVLINLITGEPEWRGSSQRERDVFFPYGLYNNNRLRDYTYKTSGEALFVVPQ